MNVYPEPPPMTDWALWGGNIAVILLFASSVFFVSTYFWKSSGGWRRSDIGINMMVMGVCLIILSAFLFVRRMQWLSGDWAAGGAILVYGGFAFVMLHRGLLVLRYNRKEKNAQTVQPTRTENDGPGIGSDTKVFTDRDTDVR